MFCIRDIPCVVGNGAVAIVSVNRPVTVAALLCRLWLYDLFSLCLFLRIVRIFNNALEQETGKTHKWKKADVRGDGDKVCDGFQAVFGLIKLCCLILFLKFLKLLAAEQ